MPIDANSYCPGGTGKKIKFCCPDHLPEFREIERMMEGEQFKACLQYVEQLRTKPGNEDRLCLMSYQATLLRINGQAEAYYSFMDEFLKKHPTSQGALGEMVLGCINKDDLDAAMEYLQRGLAEAKGQLSMHIYQAIRSLVEANLMQSRWMPARQLLHLLLYVNQRDEGAAQMLLEGMRSPTIPLEMKAEYSVTPPQNAPWREEFVKAVEPMGYGYTAGTVELLKALVEKYPAVPEILLQTAVSQAYLGRNDEAQKNLRLFASKTSNYDDAVEAEALAMYLVDDSLGDFVDVVRAEWTVEDAEKATEALLSDHRCHALPIHPGAFADQDQPPPKGMYVLLNRAPNDDAATDNYPIALGQLFLHGKQTDRDARLELVGLTEREFKEVALPIVQQIVGSCLSGEYRQTILGQISSMLEMAGPRYFFPNSTPPEKRLALETAYRRQAMTEKWPKTPLGRLDGKTLLEASADLKMQMRVAAVVAVLENKMIAIGDEGDCGELKALLKLPAETPIDPTQTPVKSVRVTRLARVDAQKLSDEDLQYSLRRADSVSFTEAVMKFGEEVLRRNNRQDVSAFAETCVLLARAAKDPKKTVEYVQRGREATKDLPQFCGMWDLQELTALLNMQELDKVVELINHVMGHHSKEQQVMVSLQQLLMQVGLLRPDGTFAFQPQGQQGGMASATPQPAADTGGLWTPDAAAPPSGGSTGGSKLWVPD